MHTGVRHTIRAWIAVLSLSTDSAAASAGPAESTDGDTRIPEVVSVHAQSTAIVQFHPAFRARYSGENSFTAASSARETVTVTGFFGVRLWRGGEVYADPEIAQGFGLRNTLGIAAGVSVTGARWDRPADTIGLAGVVNGLSRDHRNFLNAGGLGLIIGDGRLTYRREMIGEAYYSASLSRALSLMLDYQFVAHPGYNADRGPVNVLAARMHFAF